jgi:hypothetical protein
MINERISTVLSKVTALPGELLLRVLELWVGFRHLSVPCGIYYLNSLSGICLKRKGNERRRKWQKTMGWNCGTAFGCFQDIKLSCMHPFTHPFNK